MIFFVQVSTTDVSGGVDDMKREDSEGATCLEPIAANPLLLLFCAVNERAIVLIWARVAKRSRDFIFFVVETFSFGDENEREVGGWWRYNMYYRSHATATLKFFGNFFLERSFWRSFFSTFVKNTTLRPTASATVSAFTRPGHRWRGSDRLYKTAASYLI